MTRVQPTNNDGNHIGCAVEGHHGVIQPSPTGYGYIKMPKTLTFRDMPKERLDEIEAKYRRLNYRVQRFPDELRVSAEGENDG